MQNGTEGFLELKVLLKVQYVIMVVTAMKAAHGESE
jgi:hypothetical protein